MKNKITCYLVRDMLPQYAEDLLSPESKKDIEEHLNECEDCRGVYKQMTSTEPEFNENIPEVDHLKKIRNRRRNLIIASAVVIALILAGAVISNRINAAKATVNYDAASQTMVIYGKDDTNIKLPKSVNDAKELDAQFDVFHAKVHLPVLRTEEMAMEDFLPDYLGRTNESIKFIRNYMQENCNNSGLADRASKYVELSVMGGDAYTWSEEEDRIELDIGRFYWHREELYILSLLGSKSVQWQQLGYAWYLGTCVDPYNETLAIENFGVTEDYKPRDAFIRGGGTDEVVPENNRILYDAISYVCLTEGMNWGTAYESMPLSKTAVYSGPTKANLPGNDMSVLMAASFIAYLSDQHGFSEVSDFCFGEKSFEDAFGMDYQKAYENWTGWILETYGE